MCATAFLPVAPLRTGPLTPDAPWRARARARARRCWPPLHAARPAAGAWRPARASLLPRGGPPARKPPQTLLRRLSLSAAALSKFWAALKISRGDLALAISCLVLPGLILRALYAVYMFALRRLDPDGVRLRLYRPPSYRESMFSAVERAGLLQLAGGLSLGTFGLRILFAALAKAHVSDPVRVKGGTPMRFRQLATIFFWAYALSKVKKRLLLRGDVVGFRSSRQRFVVDRVGDVLICALVALGCFETIGLPLSSLAAAGGVGGLVVGLASKEIVENIFGGIALLFTSPFSPGDFVTTAAFSGQISNIGFYTTNIIDLDGGFLRVPNSLITKAVVTNLTRASRRRFLSRYSLRYKDLPAVPAIVARVREGLLQHPKTDTVGYVRSHLTEFGPFALIIEASCLVKTNSRDEFLDFQQTALVNISEAVAANGAEFETQFPPLLRERPPLRKGDAARSGDPLPAGLRAGELAHERGEAEGD